MTEILDEAPGWDAIETAVAAVSDDHDPLHWGTDSLPGQGLHGMSAYRCPGYWLLVTFGLTELFGKDSANPHVSGWGFEFTMRVPRDGAQPPAWSLRLLEQLAGYVFSTGRPFADGHRMDPGGPITGQPDTRLRALALAADPHLPAISSPHGAARFLTVVGITPEEMERMKATSTAEVLGELARHSPLLVTDPTR
ncbi:suppressor of fused domain protein [Micromonospora sp. DT31]|uniref:suppressor of fused domain protein n=1 Tax=Micromonospora sp. DT31 TaxID=3393434 RepID=UPI003CF8EB57